MKYYLKHFNTPLLCFSADNGAEMNIELLWVNEAHKELLPLDLPAVSVEGLEAWIRRRNIPKNRAYVDTFLSVQGLSRNRPLEVLRLSKGLSLNDCYWVTEDSFQGSFEQFNLYDNRFSRILGQIAFTGYGTSGGTFLSSSPEFTTNGMLPKCWRRQKGKVWLYKGGTEGASNTGNEPYSEFYAVQVARVLEINAIDYHLSKWKGRLCSVCELFTSKELAYVPVGHIVRRGGLKAVRSFYESLGAEYVKALNEMIVFDAVIFNTDRHYGNFGFLVDSASNRIVAPAPLFDHGNALMNLAGQDVFSSEKAWLKYEKTLLPCVYDDFVGEAKAVLTHEQKNRLRKLLDFHFKKHSRYNLPPERLARIEQAIHRRAAELIK